MSDSLRDLLPTTATATSSFSALLRDRAPELLPHADRGGDAAALSPHATTLVAATFAGGVVLAGDRRATMGHLIASREIEKVFPADRSSLVAMAGAAGLAGDLVRLFQVELEHYEKVEGTTLSLDGRVHRLATLIRQNLPYALQGLVVLPLYAGFDPARQAGRIFSFDATGGHYEESDFHSVGSGAVFARGAMKKLHRPDADELTAVRTVIQALVDAADDDSATGGLDLARGLYPTCWVADAAGVHPVDEATMTELVDQIVADRRTRPDGPLAP